MLTDDGSTRASQESIQLELVNPAIMMVREAAHCLHKCSALHFLLRFTAKRLHSS